MRCVASSYTVPEVLHFINQTVGILCKFLTSCSQVSSQEDLTQPPQRPHPQVIIRPSFLEPPINFTPLLSYLSKIRIACRAIRLINRPRRNRKSESLIIPSIFSDWIRSAVYTSHLYSFNCKRRVTTDIC